MKLKKLISLLLISVYLFAVGGTAYGALACECVSFETHATHVRCHHCCVPDDVPVGGAALASECCDDHHSTEVELYTRVSSDDEYRTKCVVLDLPPSLAVDCPCPAHIPFLRETIAERNAPFVPKACVISVGFRAPPVLV